MQVYAILLAIFLVVSVHSKRGRRIVSGLQILDRDPSFMPYNNVRYYVWIENGRSCTGSPHWWERWPKWIISGWCAPRNDTLKCGGALITPKIVQTACHCAADFMVGKEGTWSPSWPRHAWTVGYSVYMGLNDVRDFEFKLQVWYMWVHPKCAALHHPPGYVTYDIGWMELDIKVQDSFINPQGYFIDYAPLFTEATLNRLFKETFDKELICLVLGFGKIAEDDTVGSNVMKHTWMQVLYPDLCKLLTPLPEPYNANSTKYRSWVCGGPFNAAFQEGHNAAGDSGSPVACDNNYFAVVSSHAALAIMEPGVPTVLMAQNPIKIAIKENAAEYRAALIELVEDKGSKNTIDDELRVLIQSANNQLFSMQRLSKVKSVTPPTSSEQSASSTHLTSTSCPRSRLFSASFFCYLLVWLLF